MFFVNFVVEKWPESWFFFSSRGSHCPIAFKNYQNNDYFPLPIDIKGPWSKERCLFPQAKSQDCGRHHQTVHSGNLNFNSCIFGMLGLVVSCFRHFPNIVNMLISLPYRMVVNQNRKHKVTRKILGPLADIEHPLRFCLQIARMFLGFVPESLCAWMPGDERIWSTSDKRPQTTKMRGKYQGDDLR